MHRLALTLALAITLVACDESPHPGEHSGHATPASVEEAPVSAPATEPTVPGRVIQYAAAEGQASGYLIEPASATGDKRPGLLVIHEWWGLDDWTRSTAERFASQGYVVIAPDLYRGRSTSDPSEAHELMRGLPEDRALADLKAAWAQLAARDDVDASRIGVAGWCMGGGYALALAAAEPRLAAASVNYGRLIEDRTTLGGIHAPLLGIFAANDRGIPVADVRAFERTLRELEKEVEIHVYEGAGHAFMNPGNTEGHDAAAAADAWERIDTFLRSRLRPTG